jgi:predicted metal-dependent peptidase
VGIRLVDLLRRDDRKKDGYSRALQAARVRAAHQRSYFAPALFSLIPVETDLIGSMAVDAQWRLYYNADWLTAHTVEQNATLLIHEVSHLLRDHEARKKAAGVRDHRRWNTAGDCEINDDLHEEGLPLPGDPPLPVKYGLESGKSAEAYYNQLPRPRAARHESVREEEQSAQDCGSGAHGERRFWELPADDGSDSGVPGVDRLKAELVRRDVARRIDAISPYASDVSLAWRRWARTTLAPKVDYMATIRHVVRRALRDSTLGRYDRTYRRPHRRQACYGEFIMASFYQPRPRPGFLIDTSSSMEDSQLARAVAELGGLTRQLGYGADVVVACCDAAVHTVRKVFSATQVELYGGGGTDIGAGIRAFVERTIDPIDLLVIVTDCRTPWPEKAPPFPVVTIRVGDGIPPPWGTRGGNIVITIEEPDAAPREMIGRRR